MCQVKQTLTSIAYHIYAYLLTLISCSGSNIDLSLKIIFLSLNSIYSQAKNHCLIIELAHMQTGLSILSWLVYC